jgi:SAM-dependent methyltransferase
MTFDYDRLYRENPHALGEPSKAFVEFFADYDQANARILDLGCGQGRDALFIARLGHHVVGVDLSPAAISDLIRDAERETLPIEGVVADITTYTPTGQFDVVLVDRTLHMLDPKPRHNVLERLLHHVALSGDLLIADEPSNMAGFRNVLDAGPYDWEITRKTKGILFLKRIA